MPDPPLPEGDGLGGVRSDSGGGAGARLASHLWVGPVSGTRQGLRTCGRINDERATEAEPLSQPVVEISNTLVDLRMLPIQDIP
jgi:hypothetical protein